MNKKTLKALNGSIKKWEEIVKSTDAEDNGTANCPLCITFSDCNDCPVGNLTRSNYSSGCQTTPYENWESHQQDVHEGTYPPLTRIKGCRKCLQIAKAELNFLRGLLPKV